MQGLAMFLLVSCNLLVFQLLYSRTRNIETVYSMDVPSVSNPVRWNTLPQQHSQTHHQRPPAIALPSIRVNETKVRGHGDYYGGKGDLPHLGGFANNDIDMAGAF